MPELKIKPADMHEPKYKNVFALFSWWATSDGRVKVITNRWSDKDGKLQYIELIENDLEDWKIIPYESFFEHYMAGRLTRTSRSAEPDKPDENITRRLGKAGADLYPER